LRQLSDWLAAELAPPLIAAAAGMTGAVVATKESVAPLVNKYAFFDKPLPYRMLMLAGAAGLGIAVLFLGGRFFFALQAMKTDEEARPWWTRSRAVIPIAVTGTATCTLAQLFL
jgi:hypothetical protein